MGLLLFGISSSMLRTAREQNPPESKRPAPDWPKLVDESLAGANRQLRMDLVERLSIVGEPWCADVLRQALKEEDDIGVRSAISVALASCGTP